MKPKINISFRKCVEFLLKVLLISYLNQTLIPLNPRFFSSMFSLTELKVERIRNEAIGKENSLPTGIEILIYGYCINVNE